MGAIPSALAAINTLFGRGDGGSPEQFPVIANVGDIGGLDMSAASVDTTSHSTLVPWVTRIPTLLDAGKLTVPLYYIADSVAHQKLLNDFATRHIGNYRITWPQTGGLYWQCEMFITGIKASAPVKGVQKCDVTFEATGEPILPTTSTPEP